MEWEARKRNEQLELGKQIYQIETPINCDLITPVENVIESNILARVILMFDQIVINQPLPFKIIKQPSYVENSGDGLFLEGSANVGDVIAIYKGTVYSKSNMGLFADQIFKDNNYLITRSDAKIIDGCPVGLSNRIYQMNRMRDNSTIKMEQRNGDDVADFVDNPYALGQFANHSHHANVTCFDFDFGTDFPKALRGLIPNHLFTKPSASPYLIPSMVLVASRNIQDEEIFLDYKLDPNNCPDWYHQ
eukprot:TRINITY_DN12229_c0_g1_i1.p1 TRINITY_DN12229_c0_g1~~TRINITY_DN12229_c0_g1_i1.p1  ORF type:complete len:247 (+),score=39.11 TRINITY_DN12229_c0_g1_i1:46-786(+)